MPRVFLLVNHTSSHFNHVGEDLRCISSSIDLRCVLLAATHCDTHSHVMDLSDLGTDQTLKASAQEGWTVMRGLMVITTTTVI